MRKLVLVCLVAMLVSGNALAQSNGRMGFAWASPDSGNTAVAYKVEVLRNGILFNITEIDTNYVEFTADILIPYTIRVAGKDASGAYGPYSEYSDPEILSFGPPGPPGKPYRVQ